MVKEIKLKIKEANASSVTYGTYSIEPESLIKIRKLTGQKNLVEMVFTMKSIFLIRKVAPAKMKTILT
ncbi:MAG: hypothetical protein QXJ68_00770 [Methanocellales archaeon]